jgi:hypothetical protein
MPDNIYAVLAETKDHLPFARESLNFNLSFVLLHSCNPGCPQQCILMAKTKALIPDFRKAAQRPEFQRAVADLEKLCGEGRRPLKEAKGGFAFYLSPPIAKSLKLHKVHANFLQRGCYVFDTDPAMEKSRVAILPTADKYEVMVAMKTTGPNWSLKTQDIIQWLRRLEKAQPFIVTGINCEHVSGRFTTKIKNPAKLAMQMVELCPDLDNPDAVEDDLRQSRNFWLWWT